MAEKQILVVLIPQVMVIEREDQVCWFSDAGSLRIEFDPTRCPFSSNVFQAPAGMRLLSGTPRPGTKPASYRYRLWLNDQLVGSGEVILRKVAVARTTTANWWESALRCCASGVNRRRLVPIRWTR